MHKISTIQLKQQISAAQELSPNLFFYFLLLLLLSISIETMRRKFRDGEVRVFWDVNDFPVPKGRKIRDIIDSVLTRGGYKGEVSITAYGADPEDNPLENGIKFVHRRDKYWRLNKILVDFALAAADNHEPHLVPLSLMVVAENLKKDTEFVHLLRNVNSIKFNVLLVIPDVCHPEEVQLPLVNLAWHWTDLRTKGRRSYARNRITRPIRSRETRVFLVIVMIGTMMIW